MRCATTQFSCTQLSGLTAGISSTPVQQSLRSQCVRMLANAGRRHDVYRAGEVMKSALIVDDHPVVRAAIRVVLEAERFKVIHEASSAGEVMALMREHAPKLVVLYLKFPGHGGLEVLTRLKADDPACKVLIFTSQDPLHYQDRCLRAGAMGYVTKTNQLQ